MTQSDEGHTRSRKKKTQKDGGEERPRWAIMTSNKLLKQKLMRTSS